MSAFLKSLSESTERTLAWLMAVCLLALLQVVFHALGLAEQERDVLVGRLDEPSDDLHRLFEFLDEFVMLAVAPARAEAGELSMHDGHLGEQIVVELLQAHGEPPKFLWIGDGLRHEAPL